MFNGNAKEAIALYKEAFGTDLAMVQKYKDMPPLPNMEIPEERLDWVLHASLSIKGNIIMMADAYPPLNTNKDELSNTAIFFDNEAELKKAFTTLSKDGESIVEPQKTFYSSCCAEVRDKFGIKWFLMIDE